MKNKGIELKDDFIKLARIALTGRQQDVQLVIHQASKKFKSEYPELTDALISLLQESPTRSMPLRKYSETALPVDLDSRLQLLRLEKSELDHQLFLEENTQINLNQIISERRNSVALLKHGLHPTKSVLFTGPPGVGKTMAAKWVALKLGRPLLILDLAAVMSSFLGRTGNNIRFVLDYAKKTECVLLLDELDAIAKRRDDSSEIGELKRLVTVLLQEIDDWPSSGLLLAATNHPDLLDPAVWRRFEMVLKFDNPTQSQIEHFVIDLLQGYMNQSEVWGKILSYYFQGKSYSEIERQVLLVRKSVAIENVALEDKLMELTLSTENLPRDQKAKLAASLVDNNIISQRKAHEITGIARETIRKISNNK